MSSRELIRLTESSRANENAYKARTARAYPGGSGGVMGGNVHVAPKENTGTSTRTTTFDTAPAHRHKGSTTVKRKKSSTSVGNN